MNLTKKRLQNLTNKIVSDLPTYLTDPAVVNYNYYNNIYGLGVKVTRKNGKMTIDALAQIVTAGFAKMDAFIAKQEAFNTKQEVFNQRVETFMAEQKEFNIKQIAFNEEVIKRLDRIENCPTIKKEILKGQIRT